MPFYRAVGDIPRKRHTQFRRPDGGLFAEELMGQEGFSSESALMYHRYLPTAIVAASESPDTSGVLRPNHPLLPRHVRAHKVETGPSDDAVTGRHLLFGNDDVRLSYVVATTPSPLYRNGIGDEVLYVEAGEARVETVFGVINATAGDYIVIPTSTTYRVVPREGEPIRLLVVEARGHVGPPARYLSKRGQFLEHAPFCERDLHGPTAPLIVEDEDVEVLVRNRAGITRYVYANHPFDVVGWDGGLYPYAMSIHDFEPITGRVHQPPTVHQTFAGPNFVVCSFVPRMFDYHPQSIPTPYNHANVDSDEVLFYVDGDFMSRKGAGISQGSLTLHPSGFTHGPQPGSVEASIGKQGTDELAVMVDTFRPLGLGSAVQDAEDSDYPWTWSGRSL
ncbi:MAG TPA: homogentisate 1,2-dioxygenase [Actinomycetes bacterium]|nr:homogentisate 1,2-dioxygenase [Actinomycetes bacterium]